MQVAGAGERIIEGRTEDGLVRCGAVFWCRTAAALFELAASHS